MVGSGPYHQELVPLVTDLQLQSNVIFAGALTDMDIIKCYNVCGMFVMISREIKERGDVEGFGI